MTRVETGKNEYTLQQHPQRQQRQHHQEAPPTPERSTNISSEGSNTIIVGVAVLSTGTCTPRVVSCIARTRTSSLTLGTGTGCVDIQIQLQLESTLPQKIKYYSKVVPAIGTAAEQQPVGLLGTTQKVVSNRYCLYSTRYISSIVSMIPAEIVPIPVYTTGHGCHMLCYGCHIIGFAHRTAIASRQANTTSHCRQANTEDFSLLRVNRIGMTL